MDCKNWPLNDVVQAKVDISFDLPYEVSTTNELLYTKGKIPTNNPPPNLNHKSDDKNRKRKSKKKHKSKKKVLYMTFCDSPDTSDDDDDTPTPPAPLVKYADPTTKNVKMMALFQDRFRGTTELLTQSFEICLMIVAGLVMPEPLTTPTNIKANVQMVINLFALVAYDFAKGAIGYEDLPRKKLTLGQWKKNATTLELDCFDCFVNLLEKCFGPQSKKGMAGMKVLATDTDFALTIYRCHPRPSTTRKGIEDVNLVNFRDHNKQAFKSSGMLSPEYCYYHKTRKGPLPKHCFKAIYYPLGKIYFKLMPHAEGNDIKESLLYLTENQRNAFRANEKWYKTVTSGRMDCNKDAKDDNKPFVAKMAGKEILTIDSDSTEEEVDVTTL